MNYYLEAWRGYFDFSGRARRKEYWWFTLYHSILLVAGGLIAAALYDDHSRFAQAFATIWVLYFLASLIPSVSVSVRRLHDTDKSGWWYFVSFIPVIGEVWLLILMLSAGTSGPNQYGPDPREFDGRLNANAGVSR